MGLMWIPPHTTHPPLTVAARALGTSAPTGAKMIAASSGSGGLSVRPSRPCGPEGARELLRLDVPLPGEGEDLPALVKPHLCDDVGRPAKPVYPHVLRGTGHPQAAVADKPRAQQRGRRGSNSCPEGRSNLSSATMCSAKPPWRVARRRGHGRQVSLPDMQKEHTPQVHPSQGTPTRSPTLSRPAEGPAAATRPTTSWPGISGSLGWVSSPSTTWRSVRQTAQALTRTRTWPMPGTGLGTSADLGVCPRASRTMARMTSSIHREPVMDPFRCGKNGVIYLSTPRRRVADPKRLHIAGLGPVPWKIGLYPIAPGLDREHADWPPFRARYCGHCSLAKPTAATQIP